jgi:hypothetical protein
MGASRRAGDALHLRLGDSVGCRAASAVDLEDRGRRRAAGQGAAPSGTMLPGRIAALQGRRPRRAITPRRARLVMTGRRATAPRCPAEPRSRAARCWAGDGHGSVEDAARPGSPSPMAGHFHIIEQPRSPWGAARPGAIMPEKSAATADGRPSGCAVRAACGREPRNGSAVTGSMRRDSSRTVGIFMATPRRAQTIARRRPRR